MALVLGAGGSAGHSFHIGVLSALGDELGWDARDAALVVGTSAGSVVAAGLRAGLTPADMRARVLGRPLTRAGRAIVRRGEAAIAAAQAPDRDAAPDAAPDGPNDEASDEPVDDSAGGPVGEGADAAAALVARLRRYRIASPQRVRRALREPWRVTPGSLFSAMVPPGRLPTEYLGAPYDALYGRDWPLPATWIVAVRLDVGDRVVFGRDRRDTTVGLAVQASCAVPGYFAPVAIGGERFVDGGAHSTTNADLAAALPDPGDVGGDGDGDEVARPDLVIVSAPMAPAQAAAEWSARAAMRQLARHWLGGEVADLRAAGIEVVVLQPNADDLVAMAGDSMDPAKAPEIVEQARRSTIARLHEPDVADQLAPVAG